MLLAEFAVEPEIMSSWDNFRYFNDQFGVENGRLFSAYPSKWAKRVKKAIYAGPGSTMQKHKMVLRLEEIAKSKMVDLEREWHDLPTWTENAITEHEMHPFHSIIALANPDKHECILIADELDEKNGPWNVKTRYKIPKEANCLTECAGLLIDASTRLIIVDRHFNPINKWLSTIHEMARKFSNRKRNHPLNMLELHTAIGGSLQRKKLDPGTFIANCKKELPQLIPSGLRLMIVLWEWEDIKNRFLLTDRGGILYADGFDEKPGKKDNVHVMGTDEWYEEWKKHRATAMGAIIGGRYKGNS